MNSHREEIVDQFSKQAIPFSNSPGVRDQEALALLVHASGARQCDTVLDVACGPGLMAAAFAPVVRTVTGIDVTPAMVERARQLTAGLVNVSFDLGCVPPLPYGDHAFSIVLSRFAFHHLEKPSAVLAEMRRVCAPGGRVVVCDLLAADSPMMAAEFNRIEKLRDPSHVKALSAWELGKLFEEAGFERTIATFYRWPIELETMLSRSFPRKEDLQTIRTAYTLSVMDNRLGLSTYRRGGEIHAAYTVAIISAMRD